MKIAVIKTLAETHSLEQLALAEEAILNEQKPAIDIEGHDEGEQLTHVLAAIEIKNEMADQGIDIRTAIRNYTVRVRNSIS